MLGLALLSLLIFLDKELLLALLLFLEVKHLLQHVVVLRVPVGRHVRTIFSIFPLLPLFGLALIWPIYRGHSFFLDRCIIIIFGYRFFSRLLIILNLGNVTNTVVAQHEARVFVVA